MAPSSPPAAATDGIGSCTLFRCFCCWRRVCSPRIPRVAPDRDYMCMPAGADDRPAWSLLVGFGADSGLRLHRFRVAPSGRVLGRSNDALDIFHHVDGDCATPIWSPNATLSPDGRSLCIFCTERHVDVESSTVVPTRVLKLQLDDDGERTIAQLPTVLLGRLMPCRPVTAAGDIWAPYFHLRPRSSCRLVMQRLDKNDGRWVEAGTIEFPYEMEVPMKWGGSIFQGHAVVHDIILVSLRPAHLFFSFNCSTCVWTAITTNTDKNTSASNTTGSNTTKSDTYVPIRGRGVYVEEDDAIYFLRNSTIFAYKLHRRDHQGQQTLVELKPPTKIDSVCPFHEDGSGFLTHLGGRVMCCAVWISVGRYCSCDNFHVLISTFRVKLSSDSIPSGIEVLHSTWRRLDMLPSKPTHEFRFLQEYNDESAMSPSMLLEDGIEDLTSSCSQDSSEMLDCCRKFLSKARVSRLSRICVLKEPCIQINKALYIACQSSSGSMIVYRTNVVNGRLTCHDNPLVPHHAMETTTIVDSHYHDGRMENRHATWYFVRSGSNIHAVPYEHEDIRHFSLESRSSPSLLRNSRPTGVRFAMVLRVGQRTIALTHALEVFCYVPSSSRWTHCRTGAERALVSNNRRKAVNLSGYAALSADSFVVSEYGKCRCYLLDLRVKTWRAVVPYSSRSTSRLPEDDEVPASDVYGRGGQVLHGRCVFVDGFVYSCALGGLVAHEIILEGDCFYLGRPISLLFPWRKSWEGERMCLDYAGKDAVSGAIMFCVVEGDSFLSSPRGQDVYVTTVQVETQRNMSTGKSKPVGIQHVDIATCFVEREQGLVCASACFALAS